MRLLIDVGNTSLKAVLWENGQIQPCDINNISWQQITVVIYACVGRSELLKQLLAQAKTYNIDCFEATVSSELSGLRCAYQQVGNLGIDRWLALISGYTLYPNMAAIVVDAGTATTIDVLNNDGQHLGGWILPGLDLMTSSLTQNTQRVFDDENTPFANELGKNTPNGLKNGALVATIGAIEQARLHLNTKNSLLIFAGGYGQLLQGHFSQSIFDPMLVMKGLNYWYELAKKS
ncbi:MULTISPECIES: type III pantothenate kinase [unclassified Pseudoalteromonas]|jgi:type III pantothenate kinase|uniref:type III pantothenate kinase n=1 Tax=unclassified Pseudoalteromonas TaxID=194690 RepID=UPI0009779515|nr:MULTISPECIES: type III pantothenate kinase [unclassified Pseudoalteromonas]MDN3488583.1 type III pantothenate kinase [Pseudoalteromonas sp. APC 3694]